MANVGDYVWIAPCDEQHARWEDCMERITHLTEINGNAYYSTDDERTYREADGETFFQWPPYKVGVYVRFWHYDDKGDKTEAKGVLRGIYANENGFFYYTLVDGEDFPRWGLDPKDIIGLVE